MLASRPFHFDLMLQAPGEDRLGSQGALRSCSLAVLSHGLHPAALQHSHSLQTRGMAGPEEDQCPFPTPACLISLRLCLFQVLCICACLFPLSPSLSPPSPSIPSCLSSFSLFSSCRASLWASLAGPSSRTLTTSEPVSQSSLCVSPLFSLFLLLLSLCLLRSSL